MKTEPGVKLSAEMANTLHAVIDDYLQKSEDLDLSSRETTKAINAALAFELALFARFSEVPLANLLKCVQHAYQRVDESLEQRRKN